MAIIDQSFMSPDLLIDRANGTLRHSGNVMPVTYGVANKCCSTNTADFVESYPNLPPFVVSKSLQLGQRMITASLLFIGNLFLTAVYNVKNQMFFHWMAKGQMNLCNKCVKITIYRVQNWTLSQCSDSSGRPTGHVSNKKKMPRWWLPTIFFIHNQKWGTGA